MQEYYALRAGVYDQSMGYDQPAVERLNLLVAQCIVSQMEGLDVLEVACGPGFWTNIVRIKANSIFATDYNELTLDQARKKNLESHNVKLAVADAYNLASLNKVFSGAYAVDWFAHVPKSRLKGFLDGMHQILAPGARVCFCDQTPKERSLTGEFDEEGNHLQTRLLPNGDSFKVIKNYYSELQLIELFSEYSSEVEVREFKDSKRIVISYSFNN
jgi:ubiquinone/menaquinone biosynthesis C-methylase UbiE